MATWIDAASIQLAVIPQNRQPNGPNALTHVSGAASLVVDECIVPDNQTLVRWIEEHCMRCRKLFPASTVSTPVLSEWPGCEEAWRCDLEHRIGREAWVQRQWLLRVGRRVGGWVFSGAVSQQEFLTSIEHFCHAHSVASA